MSTDSPARARILARLQASQRQSQPPPPTQPYFAQRRQQLGRDDLVQRFIAKAVSWHAEILQASTDDWPQQLARWIAVEQLPSLWLGRQPLLVDLPSAVAQHAPACRVRHFDQSFEQLGAELFEQASAGVSVCVGAVAETGSLLLQVSDAEPRSLSLVPPLSIAVLQRRQIMAQLADAAPALGWEQQPPASNLLMITGPSKTADIQRMLVYGAHGPRRLLIVLIDEPGADQ